MTLRSTLQITLSKVSGDYLTYYLNLTCLVYKETLQEIRFHGPTIFTEILKLQIKYAQDSIKFGDNKYYILLILTDGVINDFQSSVTQIVKAAELPISIIIIGIGDADFSNMEQLDADDFELYSEELQQKASRDIVQFIPFKEYKDDLEELAIQTLEEIPSQLIDYMSAKNIKP